MNELNVNFIIPRTLNPTFMLPQARNSSLFLRLPTSNSGQYELLINGVKSFVRFDAFPGPREIKVSPFGLLQFNTIDGGKICSGRLPIDIKEGYSFSRVEVFIYEEST